MHTARQSEHESSLSGFLSYLVFEGHAVRVGMEMTACIVAYMLFANMLPWSAIGVVPEWQSIVAWFTACATVIIIDQVFLCWPGLMFRQAYQLALLGVYEKSLQIIERISPSSGRIIRLPATVYHLFRAEVFTQAEAFHSAAEELDLALLAGAPEAQVHIARSRLYRSEPSGNSLERAREELRSAADLQGDSAMLTLEEGLLLLESRDDLWTARRLLKKATEMAPETHFSGESTTQIARAGYEAARLWTGEAEEGLEGLSVAIDNLQAASVYLDTLRPLLANFYLERSHYLATHKEPEAAFDDLRRGLSLCNFPNIRKRAKKVQDELLWRYGKLSVE